MGFLGAFWNKWLETPLGPLKQATGLDWTGNPALLIYKVIAVLVLLFVLLEVYLRVSRRIRRLFAKRDFTQADEVGPRRPADTSLVESIEAARNLEGTVASLKKGKEYDRLGEVYSSVNKPKEAAKWFQKAGNRKRAASEWAKAGYTSKAAKMLMKEGDYGTAARFFEADNRLTQAAAAYLKFGDIPRAAQVYGKAGKVEEAANAFTEYFAATANKWGQSPIISEVPNSGSPQPHEIIGDCPHLLAADACFALLESERGRAKIPAETRTALLPALAARFEFARRLDLAARLYHEGGAPEKAGAIYARLGKLEEAARCYQEAGNTREASLIGARHFESVQRWADAARAYGQAGEFLRAGDCYGKANDLGHAAECYAKAGEFYGAGLALLHLKKYQEAVPLLQKIKETDKTFDVSRALLGRCFYELHDYEHCAAVLDNHLTGKRVESGNVDYFYMLALAEEQRGQLDKSRELLYRIHGVNVGYKDVTQRISNISSRISMGAADKVLTPGIADMPTQQMPMMQAVESMLGGRYRLERELGRGGMGTVYLARDTVLERPVALKFLGALTDGSEEYRRRFIREAKAAARVNHPNIVHIYDISASMGKAYIAMEYVEGASLNAYMKKQGPLPAREAVSIMAQACGALDVIHQAGIVHRDIKPDNILIAKGGLVKLTDFGLAKAEANRITDTGVVMGTPAYMSPEQTRDSDVGPASDIYSLGLVLYEMLTGKLVFTGGNLLERQKNETPPPPRTLVDAIPEALDGIVMKCIQKQPENRFQTAGELLEALRKASK